MNKEHKTTIWFGTGIVIGVILTLLILTIGIPLLKKSSEDSNPPEDFSLKNETQMPDNQSPDNKILSSLSGDLTPIPSPASSITIIPTEVLDSADNTDLTNNLDSIDSSGSTDYFLSNPASSSESMSSSDLIKNDSLKNDITSLKLDNKAAQNIFKKRIFPTPAIKKQPTSAPKATAVPTLKATVTPTPKITAAPTKTPKKEKPSVSAPAWDKTSVYLGGTKVTYQGKLYEAKWWTQGELPPSSDVWKYLSDLEESSAETSAVPNENQTDTSEEDFVVSKPAVKSDEFKVVAYYPSWKVNGLDKVRFDIVTHAIYAFAIPNADGTLRPLENPDTAKALIKKAHKNGAKVLIAVGGWSYNDVPLEPTFKEATSTTEKIYKLGDAILNLCEEYGFDGVDMDWEHPRVDDTSKSQYEKLMLYLGGKLHKKGKILTSAVLSGATPDGGVYYDAAAHSDKVLETVDWIHVMAYDGGDGERHSSYKFAKDCGKYWHTTRKMPSSKVVLGVPFYARPSWMSYEDILSINSDAGSADHSDVYGMDAYYNGINTIQKKTKYALEQLGGVMIWEITQDTTDKNKSLLCAIGKVIEQNK